MGRSVAFDPIAMPVMRPISNLAQLEKGAHSSMAIFVRAAYVWLFMAAVLGHWALWSDLNGGIWGRPIDHLLSRR